MAHWDGDERSALVPTPGAGHHSSQGESEQVTVSPVGKHCGDLASVRRLPRGRGQVSLWAGLDSSCIKPLLEASDDVMLKPTVLFPGISHGSTSVCPVTGGTL